MVVNDTGLVKFNPIFQHNPIKFNWVKLDCWVIKKIITSSQKYIFHCFLMFVR